MHFLHLKIPYFLKREINEVYIMHSLKSFAISTVVIFIPLFLLQKGYSLNSVAFYLFLYGLFSISNAFLGLWLASRKGVRHCILFSLPFILGFFLALYNFEITVSILGKTGVLIFYAFLNTMGTSLYFMGFHLEFATFCHSKSSAKEFGIVRALSTGAGIFGPLIGGLLIELFSFKLLFLVVLACLLLSVIPLFFSKEVHQPFSFKIKDIFRYRQRALPFIAEGFRFMVARYFWPVLLYMLAVSMTSIGGIFTVSNILLALFTVYIGKKTTEYNSSRILWIGTFLNSLSLMVRAFLKTISLIVVVQGVGGLSWSMVQLPYFSTFYNSSKRKGIAETIYMREFFLNMGRIMSVIMLLAFLLFLPAQISIMVTIVFGGLVMLLMPLIMKESI